MKKERKINSRMCRTLALIYLANFLLVTDKELASKVGIRVQAVIMNTLKIAKKKHGIIEVNRCASMITKANHEALKEINFEYTEDTHQVLSSIVMSLGDNLKKMLALDFEEICSSGSIIDVSPTNIGLFMNMYSKLSDSLNLPLDISSKVIYQKTKKEPKIKQKRARETKQKKVVVKKKNLPRKLKIKKQIDELNEKLADCPIWAKKAYKHKIELLEEKL
jgi:hypothetical protein